MSKEEIDEQAELEEKAQIIAEATGRTKEAVLEDLLDDGTVNLSNEAKKDASLVEQLKEAAELIATVQTINKQVSDNTVLNGGNNKTEVAVETTLEGDIVDRAIASVERKAEKIRKIDLLISAGTKRLDYTQKYFLDIMRVICAHIDSDMMKVLSNFYKNRRYIFKLLDIFMLTGGYINQSNDGKIFVNLTLLAFTSRPISFLLLEFFGLYFQ